ncbi:TVP38/TMEM64 family protein [Paenibacillus sp. J2TS4]|uniref:TVP38/TMEM64 family protein n=1 Tax=Paenibacillus sp. J2TS4 TaxID=2807194 RepID=UPI001B03AD8B|nr:VTT domain-containing protein [Paenibacillus sp. J2TS4]GIP35218.1 hypothetical protein J2TS4_44280 [Paenibacillus sp. J2TS4]
MQATIEQWIEWLLEVTQLEGYSILLITAPLAVIQGFFGFFPFATLIVLHLTAFGLGQGLLASWMVGTLASVVVFSVCRYFFFDWFNRRWGKKLQKYEKWQYYMDTYGVWVIIFLRTLPIMPNNLISFMSAISPIKLSAYLWSSLIGNLSHIWLVGLIGSSIVMPELDVKKHLLFYAKFCLVLIIIFIARHYKSFRKRRGTM